MPQPFRVRVLLRVLTLAVIAFFVLPVAASGRPASLTTPWAELRPSTYYVLEDALRSDGGAELQAVRAARAERLPVLSFSVALAGFAFVDRRSERPSAFLARSTPNRPLPRMRRILRMESDDPPRV